MSCTGSQAEDERAASVGRQGGRSGIGGGGDGERNGTRDTGHETQDAYRTRTAQRGRAGPREVRRPAVTCGPRMPPQTCPPRPGGTDPPPPTPSLRSHPAPMRVRLCGRVRARPRSAQTQVRTNTGPHKHNARVTVTCCVSTLQGASMVQCTSMVTCCLLPLCHGLCRVPPLSLCASTVVCRHCPSLPRGFLSPSLPRSTLPTHSQTARGPRRVVAVGNYPHASELTRVNYTQGRGAQGQ